MCICAIGPDALGSSAAIDDSSTTCFHVRRLGDVDETGDTSRVREEEHFVHARERVGEGGRVGEVRGADLDLGGHIEGLRVARGGSTEAPPAQEDQQRYGRHCRSPQLPERS